MFNLIPPEGKTEMLRLESIDAQDRADGTPRLKRLRQIPPETGKFLALLAAMAPPGKIVEIGTSAGYSALWIALGARQANRCVHTIEVLKEKTRLAEATFARAGFSDSIHLANTDARNALKEIDDIAFCFLDAEKEIYSDCYDLVVPRMVTGGIFAADNVISHRDTLASFLDKTLTDDRLDALIVPIGKGVLFCRRI